MYSRRAVFAFVLVLGLVELSVQLPIRRQGKGVPQKLNYLLATLLDEKLDTLKNSISNAISALSKCCGNNDEKIWLFAVGDDFPPHDIIAENGSFVGTNKELMEGVCAIAKKKCKLVLYPYDSCITTHAETGLNMMGEGLSGGWIDACMAWGIGVTRQLFADFTLPITEGGSHGLLFTRHDNTLDVSGRGGDLTGLTVAIWDSFVIDAVCLRRGGWTGFDVVVVQTLKEGIAAVTNGTADAFLTIQSSLTQAGSDFKVLDGFDPPGVQCSDGLGIAVRKDSELPQWWNKAYLKYKALQKKA